MTSIKRYYLALTILVCFGVSSVRMQEQNMTDSQKHEVSLCPGTTNPSLYDVGETQSLRNSHNIVELSNKNLFPDKSIRMIFYG